MIKILQKHEKMGSEVTEVTSILRTTYIHIFKKRGRPKITVVSLDGIGYGTAQMFLLNGRKDILKLEEFCRGIR